MFSKLLPLCRSSYNEYALQFSGWAVFLKDNWATDVFVTNYLPLILFPILYTGAKLWRRDPIVRTKDMDFFSGLDEVEAASYVHSPFLTHVLINNRDPSCRYEEPPPRNWMEKFWGWLVSTRDTESYLCLVANWHLADVKYPALSYNSSHVSRLCLVLIYIFGRLSSLP